ncbi:MAG TPA: SAM-dependent methyltransferase [Candidatus Binatia bacterium]|nr:SAM-dependent methyltransferase [Candidatus Binatia bacterium]
MMPGRASRTAEYVAFFRALESARPPRVRLFDDPYARHFLRPSLRRAVSCSRVPPLGGLIVWCADRRLPGARTSAIARTRVIDDAVRRAGRDGIDQVVILGAGFDSRAYRLPELRAAAVFEVDHPATHAVKRVRLRRALPTIPANVRFVPIDFNRQQLPGVLADHGLDAQRRVLFLWEGVTNYLTAAAVDAVLRFVARCAAGTRLIFTYVHRGALDGSVAFEGAATLMRAVAQLAEPWTFGLDPSTLRGYLADRGLRLEDDAGAREYRARCFGSAADRMRGYDFYHVAIASVPNANA